MHSILAWLTEHGYPGLFLLLMLGIVGLPIPDETLLVFCGYLIYKGQLHGPQSFAWGFAGSMCGITLSYLIGRFVSRGLIVRYGKYLRFTEQHLDDVSARFNRIGPWLLTVGYFILGVRHFTALVAGMSRLHPRRFALFAYSGAALWVATFLTLGYFLGERWEHTSEVIHRYSIIAAVVLAVAAALVWLLKYRTRPSKRE